MTRFEKAVIAMLVYATVDRAYVTAREVRAERKEKRDLARIQERLRKYYGDQTVPL